MKDCMRYAWAIGLMLNGMLLSACTAEAPPETRAGEWSGATDCGDFTLDVSDSGTSVKLTQILSKYKDQPNLNLVVGSTALNLNAPGQLEASLNSKGSPSYTIEDGTLDLNLGMANMTIISLDASFSSNNQKLSGTVHFYPQEKNGGCKARFAINR